MSKASMGVSVVALVVSMIALGGFAYTYVTLNQAIQKAQNNNGNNNQQTTVTVYGNSLNNGGCTNCTSQGNDSCTNNCNGGGTGTNTQTNDSCTNNCNGGSGVQSIVITTSGTTTGVYQCQSTPSAQTQNYTGPTTSGDLCYLAGGQILTFSFAAGASGLTATGSFQSQGNVDAKFVDVTGSQTLQTETGVTSSSFNHALTAGHIYLVQFTNDEGQNDVLTISFAITG